MRDGFVSGTCYSQHIGSYLSPREFVRYWVQWDHGNIRVGIGEAVGGSKIMEHQFPTAYPIINLLLRNGQWIIYLKEHLYPMQYFVKRTWKNLVGYRLRHPKLNIQCINVCDYIYDLLYYYRSFAIATSHSRLRIFALSPSPFYNC